MSEKPGFQTKTQIKALLDAAGLAPRKRLGQCFLIDRNLMNKLLDAAEVGTADCVLEVGGGTGSLTSLLAQRAGAVVSVEIDPGVGAIARQQLAEFRNVRHIIGDALANKSRLSPELLAAVREARADAGGPLKLVANLPYDIATALVIDLLLSDLGVKRLCFTVQTEVADRFLASPGTSDYGPVSIISQVLCCGQRVARAPAEAFWPAPKVSSTLVRLDSRDPSEVAVADPAGFAAFVRPFFNYRRKTLSSAARQIGLSAGTVEAMAQVGIDPQARPETISVEQWTAWVRAIG